MWNRHKNITLTQSIIQENIDDVCLFSKAFGLPISVPKTKKIVFYNQQTTLQPHVMMSRITISKQPFVPMQLAGSKWGSSPKLIIDFYKLYNRSKMEYGIQFLANVPVNLFKTPVTLQNSTIRVALGLHKHTAVDKLKEFSGLPALKNGATMQRNHFFTEIQYYGYKHAVFPATFVNLIKLQHQMSSWCQYLKDHPNWKKSTHI